MYHKHIHRRPSPALFFLFGILLFWLLGFKMFFFLPFLFIFGGFGMWGHCDSGYRHEDDMPKRKQKPKRDTYYDDSDDVTYV